MKQTRRCVGASLPILPLLMLLNGLVGCRTSRSHTSTEGWGTVRELLVAKSGLNSTERTNEKSDDHVPVSRAASARHVVPAPRSRMQDGSDFGSVDSYRPLNFALHYGSPKASPPRKTTRQASRGARLASQRIGTNGRRWAETDSSFSNAAAPSFSLSFEDSGSRDAEAVAPPDKVSVQDKSQELAKQLANPLSSLISIPIRIDYNSHIGPDGDGSSVQVNVQPVIPFSLNDDWLVISRTIVPITFLDDIPFKGDDESGIGDVLQSFFFSPSKLTEDGWVWGVGPVALLPTASPDVLGTDQWAFGPTGVLLKQEGPWTVGILANHLWSVENSDDHPDINSTYCEPWVSYTFKSDTTVSLSTETIYDWTAKEFSIPIVFTVEQLLEIGEQYISIGGAVRYWADSTEEGPQDLGFQLSITYLLPK